MCSVGCVISELWCTCQEASLLCACISLRSIFMSLGTMLDSNLHYSDTAILCVIITDKLKVLIICKMYVVFCKWCVLYFSDCSHSLKTYILSWGGSSYGLHNALPRVQWECVCLCLFNHFFTSVVSSYCNKKHACILRCGHEELIHAGTWNVSSLRSDSPRGNKEVGVREGEETHENGMFWPGECCPSARGSSCLYSGSSTPLGFP